VLIDIGDSQYQSINQSNVFVKPFLHEQMSQSAYTENQPTTPNEQAMQICTNFLSNVS
jgi:hypothetical protein